MVLSYFLVSINAFSLPRIRLIIGLLIACGVIIGAEAILAYHTGFLGDQLLLYAPGDDRAVFGNRVRGFGTLQDPNDFGQFLLVCIALLGVFWKPRRTLRNLMLLAPPAMVLVYAVNLTFSRGALIGLGAVLFFALYRKGRQVVALTTAPLTLAGLYVLRFTGGREIALDSTTMGRVIAWGAGIGALIHHPVFGVGFNRFTKEVNDLTAHNSFVLCFAELGLFGYFFWLGLILVTVSGLWMISRMDAVKPEDEAYLGTVRAVQTAVFAFLVSGWFLSRTYAELLYVLLAVAACLIQLRAGAIAQEKFRLGRLIPRTLVWQAVSVLAVYLAVKVRAL
jgi:O-antigen ligase